MVNAPIRIVLGVKSKTRQLSERFSPTITATETFHLETSATTYQTDFTPFLTTVWNYITSIWTNSEIDVHYTIRVENVTAPGAATGSWIQAKQNFDGQFSQRDIPTSQPIQDTIFQVIQVIISNANYE